MRIGIISDLHQEHFQLSSVLLTSNADIYLFAGDIDNDPKRAYNWMRKVSGGKPVVYVPGNHCYFGHNYVHHLKRMKALYAGTNIKLGHRLKWEYRGITFLACTLWTDYSAGLETQTQAMNRANNKRFDLLNIRMPDPSVKGVSRLLRAEDTVKFHSEDMAWLKKELDSIDGPTVIITHYAPSVRSVYKDFVDSPIVPQYASHLDHFILANPQISHFIHGHIHQPVDYYIGETRVVSNPSPPNKLIKRIKVIDVQAAS